MSEQINREDFHKCLNNNFQLDLGNGKKADLKLIEVSEVNQTDEEQKQESFSLVFLAPNEIPAIPETYRLSNEHLGEMDIALSPFAQDEKGIKFEALFSFLIN